MPDRDRIEALRRRIQQDPASIAFAQLAEELRRARQVDEAIEVCRTGLAIHPGYVSARVTLGRALLEAGNLEQAHAELTTVLRSAPENLSAIRGLAEVHRRRGELPEALEQYRAASELAHNDPGIDQIVRDIRKEIAPSPALPAPARTAPHPGAPATPSVPAPRSVHLPPALINPERHRTERTLARLEGWLTAILAERRARLMNA